MAPFCPTSAVAVVKDRSSVSDEDVPVANADTLNDCAGVCAVPSVTNCAPYGGIANVVVEDEDVTMPSAASLTVLTVNVDPGSERLSANARLHVRGVLEVFATSTAVPAVPFAAPDA